jgi:hypothetical protein
VRSQINEAGSLLRDLQSTRRAVRPWQEQSIATVTPVAANVATHTEAAIKHLKGEPEICSPRRLQEPVDDDCG